MLDLRAQLLKAGLVTKEQADKAAQAAASSKKGFKQHLKADDRPQAPVMSEEEFAFKARQKQLAELKSMQKGEQYDTIRRWVLRNRLDAENAFPAETPERFFFEQMDGSVGWLVIPPSIVEQIKSGQGAVMAFMSHHGVAHCVVPRDIAEDVREVFPTWVRVFCEENSPVPDETA